MIPVPGFLRFRQALAILAASVLAAGLGASPALAQSIQKAPDRLYSSGPFRLQDQESLGYGLLLPAVQKAREAARFVLTDGQGKTLYSFEPPAGATMLNVKFHAKSPTGSPAVEIIANDAGPNSVPIIVPIDPTGILIGLLLPAVQRNGNVASPIAASMQSFNVNGGTMTHSAFSNFPAPGE